LIGILVISRCAAPPYPAVPDFPLFRGQNKALQSNPFTQRIAKNKVPPAGGKVVAPATKRGAFPRPQGGCMVLAAKGGIRNGAEGAVPHQRARSANQ